MWTKLKDIYLDPYKEDDMFTRRSVLNLLSFWVKSQEFVCFGDDETCKSNLSDLKCILANGICDFDWETRCACVNVLTALVEICEATNCENVLELFTEIYENVVRKALQDCEFKVREVTLLCLQRLKKLVGLTGFKNGLGESPKHSIENFDNVISRDEKINSDWLRHLVTSWDFEELLKNLIEMDEKVRWDPISFLDDIIASAKKADENLLDCY